MPTTWTALIIPAPLRQPLRIEKVDTDVATLQAMVEGNFGSISGKDWHMYLNDEAGYIPLPINLRAEVLIREAGVDIKATVTGTALFLGHRNDGAEADAPAHLLQLAEHLFEFQLLGQCA